MITHPNTGTQKSPASFTERGAGGVARAPKPCHLDGIRSSLIRAGGMARRLCAALAAVGRYFL